MRASVPFAVAACLLAGCSAPQHAAKQTPSALLSTSASTSADGLERPLLPISGRILINIEHEGTPSQPAYIDATGIHLVPVQPDTSLAHLVWASTDAVLFDSERSGPRHVFRMGLDGSDVTEITPLDQWQDSVATSPDGSTIAYGTADPKSQRDTGLHIARADGGSPRALTRGQAVGAPVASGEDAAAFSPDGRWVAYVHISDAAKDLAGLWMIRTDGTGAHRLTADATEVSYPRWSPDGSTILFTEYEDDPSPTYRATSLWAYDVASGRVRQVGAPSDECGSSEADWSPSGTQIVFRYYCREWDHNELRIMSADGTDMQRLWISPYSRTAETPDWGP